MFAVPDTSGSLERANENWRPGESRSPQHGGAVFLAGRGRQEATARTVSQKYAMKQFTRGLILCAVLLPLNFPLRADVSTEEQARFEELGWQKSSFMIPMRDGARLYTEVFRPSQKKEPLPFLKKRTPYNASITATNFVQSITNQLKELVADGYLFVSQDIRGKFQSEGQFVMMRPPRREGRETVDESTDTYDTMDWLLKNVPNHNGRAGIYGTTVVVQI